MTERRRDKQRLAEAREVLILLVCGRSPQNQATGNLSPLWRARDPVGVDERKQFPACHGMRLLFRRRQAFRKSPELAMGSRGAWQPRRPSRHTLLDSRGDSRL